MSQQPTPSTPPSQPPQSSSQPAQMPSQPIQASQQPLQASSQPIQVPQQPLQASSQQPLQASPQPIPPLTHPPRFVKVRQWLRSPTGRVVVPLVALFFGMLLGIFSLLIYGLSGEGSVVVLPALGKQDIVIQADKAFVTNLIQKNIQSSGMPGTVGNIRVDLAAGDQITINGDDTFGVLGLGVTKHFQVVVQLFIATCSIQAHVVHADLSSIPVTGFAQTFESSINQQLAQKPSGLPNGFIYCATSVKTQPGGITVTYSATPIALNGGAWYA
jgi:hypothetical protein